jgi:hypothetical protein
LRWLGDFDWQFIFSARLDFVISILEAAVVAQSDPIQGQLPFAFYQLREGAVEPTITQEGFGTERPAAGGIAGRARGEGSTSGGGWGRSD